MALSGQILRALHRSHPTMMNCRIGDDRCYSCRLPPFFLSLVILQSTAKTRPLSSQKHSPSQCMRECVFSVWSHLEMHLINHTTRYLRSWEKKIFSSEETRRRRCRSDEGIF